MARTRIKISSTSIAETEINPVWSGEFTRSIERDRIFHLHELKGELTLTGADFDLVNDLVNPCEKITLIVERYCVDEWVEYWAGQFTKFDTSQDFGGTHVRQCVLRAKVKPDDIYACLMNEWDEEINFFLASSTISTKALAGTYEVLGICTFCTATIDPDPCDDIAASGEACLEYSNITSDPNCAGGYRATFAYHRIVDTGTALDPPPYDSGWTLISGDQWWRCPDEEPVKIGVLSRGRRFDDTLEYLLLQTGCGLTLRSHFLGINATHAEPPDNDAYDYATENYQDITIHQKSDVKRPYSTNPSLSQVWKMKLKDALADLNTMFNLFWKIEGTDLILEHISYFEALEGADYSTRKMKLQLEYDAETPKREIFKWSDPDVRTLFLGFPIEYDCGNGDRERRVTLFNNDVAYVNDELNQDRVSDDGWVLICNRIVGGQYSMIDINYPMRFFNLHDKLHRHYRPFLAGKMNGEVTTFLTAQKLQKQPTFTVPLCCNEEHDPGKYITTPLGQGYVQESIENIKTETLQLNLNY